MLRLSRSSSKSSTNTAPPRVIPPVQPDQGLAPRRADVALSRNGPQLQRNGARYLPGLGAFVAEHEDIVASVDREPDACPQRLGDPDEKNVAQEDVDDAPGHGDEA